ncbi:hypothetical protein U1Q18_040372 [Sarracenia purpurea var. burkii]
MSFRHLFRSRSSGQDALRFMASLFEDFLLQAIKLDYLCSGRISLFCSLASCMIAGLVSLRPVGIFSPTKAVREMGFLLIFVEYVKTKFPDLDGGDLGLKEKSEKRVPKLEAGQKEEDTVISEMNERIAPPSLMFRSSMNSYRIDLDSGSGEEGEEGISNNIVEKEVDEEEEAIGASRNKGNIETGVAVQAKSNTEDCGLPIYVNEVFDGILQPGFAEEIEKVRGKSLTLGSYVNGGFVSDAFFESVSLLRRGTIWAATGEPLWLLLRNRFGWSADELCGSSYVCIFCLSMPKFGEDGWCSTRQS